MYGKSGLPGLKLALKAKTIGRMKNKHDAHTVEHREQSPGMFRWHCSCGFISIAVNDLQTSEIRWQSHLQDIHGISNARKIRVPCPNCGTPTRSVGYSKGAWFPIGRWCATCKVVFPYEDKENLNESTN